MVRSSEIRPSNTWSRAVVPLSASTTWWSGGSLPGRSPHPHSERSSSTGPEARSEKVERALHRGGLALRRDELVEPRVAGGRGIAVDPVGAVDILRGRGAELPSSREQRRRRDRARRVDGHHERVERRGEHEARPGVELDRAPRTEHRAGGEDAARHPLAVVEDRDLAGLDASQVDPRGEQLLVGDALDPFGPHLEGPPCASGWSGAAPG